MASGRSRAFDMLRSLPRIDLYNLKPNPGARKKLKRKPGIERYVSKSNNQRQNYTPVGYETGKSPFYLRFKAQPWYTDHLKLAYVPLPLGKLQLIIDLGRVNVDIPIDVCQLAISGMLRLMKPMENEGGYILQDEDIDKFAAEVNLEVQWATEPIIAAVERAGSTMTTAYYDPVSLDAARDPVAFFQKGKPIPKRMLPPQNLIEYYSDPKKRGYLADPDAIAEERYMLAQKYGYKLPDLNKSPKCEMLIQRKDPRQIFYGLQPGWVVNLKDKNILKPTSPQLKEYYAS